MSAQTDKGKLSNANVGLCADSFRFTWKEFSGSLGDLGLFIPLVVAMTIVCGLDIGVILICAGLMNILTGLIFRQPIPVQPMKAIAAVVIAEGLLPDELVAVGLLMGILMLGFSSFVNRINGFIPKTIVRGIQLGVGLKLAMKGATWIVNLHWLGWDSILTAILVGCFILFALARNKPILVFIFLSGFFLQYLGSGNIFPAFDMTLPDFHFHWPSASTWTGGLIKGVLPQMPLTLLNSVIAVCALSSDYFPQRGISPKKMAASVGLMNILCVPFGGIPMCHGAGGLAAQYRFGARTGGSVIMLGLLKITVGLLFGGALLGLLQSYPMAILAPMLVFAGFELAKAAKDVTGNVKDITIALTTAVFIVGVNTWVGFLVGCAIALLCQIPKWAAEKQTDKKFLTVGLLENILNNKGALRSKE